MKPTPPDWPRISPSLYYDDPRAAIEWLCRAFGFEVRLLVEGDGGRVDHSELVLGGGVIMVSGTDKVQSYDFVRSPAQVGGGNTQNLFVYVDDADAHCARAREAGARITKEPTTVDYGGEYWIDRSYSCVDAGGHHWWFAQRLRNPPGRG
jgi:uncharacterized glyoxalase superfamily protein PhnB